ncbi:MAG: response regulator [Candidatus Solibacter usitatus]|nr:response regulator [Candidatus Solibacter usitatus]
MDPDPGIRAILQSQFASQGWGIDYADDGEQGLAQIQASLYDAVVLETRLAGMNGIDLFEQICQTLPKTPVILLVSESTSLDVVRALRGRAYGYLSKPVSELALADSLRRALAVEDWQSDIEVISALPEWISLDLRCKLEIVERLLPFIRGLEQDLSEQDREDGITAFREVLMNAIEHGGSCNPGKKVRVAYVRTARAILYHVADPGPGFSFDRLPHAAISNPPDSPLGHHQVRSQLGIRPGGFGLLLTRSLVDEVIYNEAGNQVLVIKYLGT